VSNPKTLQDIRDISRITKSAIQLVTTKNKSMHDLSYYKIGKGVTDASKSDHKNFTKSINYSFCDFEEADLTGHIFKKCNFSFSINLDKAKIDDGALIECNLTGADLPDEKKMVKCNKTRVTDKEVEEMFK